MPTKIKHLLNYRDLFLIFIWRDFNVKYKQAALGIAWAVLQPFSFMLLFTFIFTYALPIKVSSSPPAVFYYSGLLPWTFFASSVTYSIQSFTGNYYLVRRIYFPRIILPMVGVFTAFVDFLIASVLFIGLLLFYKIPLTATALWFFPLLLLLLLFTLSLVLVLSISNVFYRDVGLVSSFLIQVFFFITPVLYSVDKIPSRLKPYVFLNPLTFIIENMKRCLLENRPVIGWQYAIMLSGLLALLFVSYKFFHSTERKLADVL